MLTKEEREIRHKKRCKNTSKDNKSLTVTKVQNDSNGYKNPFVVLNLPVSPDELKQTFIHHKSFIEFLTDKTIYYFASRPNVSIL